MVKDSLITRMQAQTLKELGFKEITLYCYSKGLRHEVSVPTTDEAIDWLRRKYNIIIYNKIEPFVDPTDDTHKTILFIIVAYIHSCTIGKPVGKKIQ